MQPKPVIPVTPSRDRAPSSYELIRTSPSKDLHFEARSVAVASVEMVDVPLHCAISLQGVKARSTGKNHVRLGKPSSPFAILAPSWPVKNTNKDNIAKLNS